MNEVLDKIELELGFELPRELKTLFELIDERSGSTYIIDRKKGAGHWFLDAKYFLLNSVSVNSQDLGEFSLETRIVPERESILIGANKKASWSMSHNWNEHKTFVFAWSNEHVEKDACFAYLFEDDGRVKGIYAHLLNWVEHKIFVANKLTDIIDFSEIKSNSGAVTLTNLLNKNQKTYQDLLGDSYKIIDLESVDDVKDYDYLLKIFSQMSNDEFSPTMKKFSEVESIRAIELEIDNKAFSVQLEGDTDYIDLKIISFVNGCLTALGKTKRQFVAFSTASFGTEVALAYLTSREISQLKKLPNINIVAS